MYPFLLSHFVEDLDLYLQHDALDCICIADLVKMLLEFADDIAVVGKSNLKFKIN